jgi:crotonobetaine/carnitine-CoA ligase
MFTPESWTLPDILDVRASDLRDKIYLDVPFEQKRFSYLDVKVLSLQIARALIADDINPGDRMVLFLPNCSEYVLAWFGASFAGIVEVPINTAYSGEFLAHQLRVTRPRCAVVTEELAARLVECSAASCIERYYIVGEDVRATLKGLRRLGKEVKPFTHLEAGGNVQLPCIRARDLASIFFTSGTTGLSKGVAMPHAQMAFFAEEAVALTRMTEGDVHMSVGPLFHGNAQFCAAYPALVAGGRFVLREKFSASRWSRQLGECGATVTNLVGVMMDWAWSQPPIPEDSENEVRCVWAVPTAFSYLEEFKTRYGVEMVTENFGLTETAMPILTPYGSERPSGSCGLAVSDWFDVELVDRETDEPVANGEAGELVVRPKVPWTVSLGYWGMPAETVASFRNLWFHTGDALRRDEDGWFYFVDRLKDAIRRRGENISSFEIEHAVLRHEAIVDCAAIGVPAASEAGEDEVMLFVVAREPISKDDVARWCRSALPAFAQPKFIRLVGVLPVTPSGKVRKVELRETALAGSLDEDRVDGAVMAADAVREGLRDQA